LSVTAFQTFKDLSAFCAARFCNGSAKVAG